MTRVLSFHLQTSREKISYSFTSNTLSSILLIHQPTHFWPYQVVYVILLFHPPPKINYKLGQSHISFWPIHLIIVATSASICPPVNVFTSGHVLFNKHYFPFSTTNASHFVSNISSLFFSRPTIPHDPSSHLRLIQLCCLFWISFLPRPKLNSNPHYLWLPLNHFPRPTRQHPLLWPTSLL